MKHNLKRKKIHWTKQDFNFLKDNFSNIDTERTAIQFRNQAILASQKIIFQQQTYSFSEQLRLSK